MKEFIKRAKNKVRVVSSKIRHPFNEVERTYTFRDPWGLGKPSEEARFAEINEIIKKEIGTISSILEISSGEGHQTEWLSKLSFVHGIEISKTAVKRARARFMYEVSCKRNPAPTFSVGSLPVLPPLHKYGLVTAFEVLYYLSDEQIPQAIQSLTNAAAYRMISYHHNKKSYNKVQGRLDPIVFSLPGVKHKIITHNGESWTVAWW